MCLLLGQTISYPLTRACDASEICGTYHNSNIPCPTPITDDNTCTSIRCYGSSANKCIEYPIAEIPPLTLDGVACSADPQARACYSSSCVDAQTIDCSSSVSCTIAVAPSIPGVYNLTLTTNSSNVTAQLAVLDWPLVTRLQTESRTWAYGDTHLLGLSPSTSFAIEYTSSEMDVQVSLEGVDVTPSAGVPPLPLASTQALSLRIAYPMYNITYELPYVIPFTYLQIPSVYSICPFFVLSRINSTLVVQGGDFADTDQLACLLDAVSVPVVYLNDHSVSCTVFPLNLTDSISYISVSNDGVAFADFQAALAVQGSCDVRKPYSVAHDNACECIPGYFDSGGVCTECPNGAYQPNYGQQLCLPCDSSEDTGGSVRSTNASACECRDGRYRANADDATCKLCEVGMQCERGQVSILPGYWRASASSYVVTKCTQESACSGGEEAGNALCRQGYHGPLCSACATGYGKVGENCVVCENQGVNFFIVFVMLAGISFFLYLIIRGTTAYTDKHDTTGAVIKITWTWLQLTYYIGKISANWSDNSSAFFASIVPASLSPSFLYVQCASQFTFYQRIAFTMVLPVTVSGGLFLFFVGVACVRIVLVRRRPDIIIQRAQLAYRMSLLIILYMMHPMLALDVISALRCVKVPGTGDTFVQTDLTVSCSTGAYATFRVFAVLYIFVYLLGGIAAVTIVIFRNHSVIKQASLGVTHDAGLRYVYFIRGYTDKCYLFELAVMARKLGIVICSAMLSVGLQLVWASIIIGVSLAYTVMNKPYSSVLVNRLDIVALCALLITLILGFHSIFIQSSSANTPIFVVLVFVNILVLVGLVVIALTKVEKKLRVAVNRILAAIDERMNVDDGVSEIAYTMNPQLSATQMKRAPTGPLPPNPNVTMHEIEFI